MKKIPVWKNVTLILATLVIIMVATFAWFYTGPTANVGTISVAVGNARYIQVSGDLGNNWSEELDVEVGVNNKFKEISGDGNSFFAPVYDVLETENGYSAQLISFDEVNEDELYYEQILDFRADSIQNVYLAPESSVTAIGSNGYIDGAIRIAFFEIDGDGNETLKFIWAPNSMVEYSYESNSFNRNGSVEPYYYYQKTLNPVDTADLTESNDDINVISTDGTDEFGCGYDEDNRFMWTNGANMPENAPSVLTVDASDEDELFRKRIKVKVWLEGHDRECVSLLNGQRFTMTLKFTAQEVE